MRNSNYKKFLSGIDIVIKIKYDTVNWKKSVNMSITWINSSPLMILSINDPRDKNSTWQPIVWRSTFFSNFRYGEYLTQRNSSMSGGRRYLVKYLQNEVTFLRKRAGCLKYQSKKWNEKEEKCRRSSDAEGGQINWKYLTAWWRNNNEPLWSSTGPLFRMRPPPPACFRAHNCSETTISENLIRTENGQWYGQKHTIQ